MPLLIIGLTHSSREETILDITPAPKYKFGRINGQLLPCLFYFFIFYFYSVNADRLAVQQTQ